MYFVGALCVKQPNLEVVVADQAVINDNRISCSFSRMKKVDDPAHEVYTIDSGSYYYILMARGPMHSSQYQSSSWLNYLTCDCPF